MKIVIDFDGTIVENQCPRIGKLKDRAVETIQKLKEMGHYIIISSCRTNRRINPTPGCAELHQKLMADFLTVNKIPFDEIDDGKQGKIMADVYIDDRAVAFRENWGKVLEDIKSLDY